MVEQTTEKKKTSNISSSILKVVLGLVLVTLGIWAIMSWWSCLVSIFKGCIGLFLILAGLVTIAIAKN